MRAADVTLEKALAGSSSHELNIQCKQKGTNVFNNRVFNAGMKK